MLDSDFEEKMVGSVSDSLNDGSLTVRSGKVTFGSMRLKGFGVKANCRLFSIEKETPSPNSFGDCLFTGSGIRDLGSRKVDAILTHGPKKVMIETSIQACRLIPT